jgi:hypothetical protein
VSDVTRRTTLFGLAALASVRGAPFAFGAYTGLLPSRTDGAAKQASSTS